MHAQNRPLRPRLWAGFWLAIACGLPGPAPAQQPDAAADARFQAASELFTHKKYPEAAGALEKLVAEFPKHPKALRARLQLGTSLLESGKPGPAAAAFQAVLTETQAPDLRFEAHYGAGRAFLAAEEDTKAGAALTEAAALSQQDGVSGPAVRLLLGGVLQRVGKPAEAARVFSDFLTRWPEHAEAPQAYFGVAESHRLAGNHLEAAVTFRNFTEKHWRLPQASQAALRAGDSFLAIGKLPDAEAEYRRVLKDYLETPAAAQAQIGLGRVAFAQRDYPSARSAFQAAAVVFGNAPGIPREAELRVAETYLVERNLEEARARYTALAALSETAAAREGRYGLGLTHLADGRVPAAAAEFNRLVDDRESGRWGHLARLRLAELRIGSGEAAAALTLIRPVLGDRPEPEVRDEVAVVLAEALLHSQDGAGAEAELNGLLNRSPDGPLAARATVLLAEARVQAMKPAEGAALLAELLKKNLDADLRAAALAGLGQAQLKNKQEKEGAASLEEVLEKHPASPAAPGAARALLAHYRSGGHTAQVARIEQILEQRYGGAPASADDALLARAEQLNAAGKYQEALEILNRLADRNLDRPRRARRLAGSAEALAALRKPEAAAAVAALVKEAPTLQMVAEARCRVGRAFERAGNPSAALAEYRAARAAGPDAETAPGVLLAIGRLLGDARKPAEGEPALRELISKYPKSAVIPDALYELAWGLQDRGRPDQARPVFVRLATDYPTHALAFDASLRVGEQDYRAGDYAAAAARYRAAMQGKAPVADRAAYKLGWALRQAADPAGAAQAFLRAVELAPTGPAALESRVRAGEAFLVAAKAPEALAQFEAVLSRAPRSRAEVSLVVQAKVGAAQAHLMGGDAEKALALAGESALPANGWYGGRAQLVRAEAVLLKEGPKPAAAEFTRAAALFGRHRELAAEAWYRAAECHDKLGDAKAARAAWQRVVEQYRGTDWAQRSRERLNVKPATSGSRAEG